MISPFQRTIAQAVRGPDSLDTVTLVGIILSSSYVFQADHATADDVTDWEVTGAGYARISAVGAVADDAVAGTVLVSLESVTDADLSAVTDAGWVGWFLPGATDTLRLYVGANQDDSGNGQASFTPNYDDGLYIEGGVDLIVSVDGGNP